MSAGPMLAGVDVMKSKFVPVAWVLFAAGLAVAVAACQPAQNAASAGPASGAASGAQPATSAAAGATGSAAGPASAGTANAGGATPSATAASTSADNAVDPVGGKTGERTAAEQQAYDGALTAWKSAASAPQAILYTYFDDAASDLRQVSNPNDNTAVEDLTYLSQLPVTNVPASQEAQAQVYVKYLDTFFNTPGLPY
jgi:hypothetical protein